MRKFLIKTLLFSLLVVAILLGLEAIVRGRPSSYAYKNAWMEANADKVSVLILGSPHTYYALRPDVIGDSVFNLANVSQTPEYDYALLRKYEDGLANLRKVVIPISYFTYQDPKLEDMSRGLAINYRIGMDLPVHGRLSPYNLTLYDFPGYVGRVKHLFTGGEMNHCDSLGFGLGYDLGSRHEDWAAEGKERAEGLTQSNPGRPEEVYAFLVKTIEWCRDRGVEVVFVSTPTWPTFREHNDRRQFEEMEAMTRRLTDRYGIPYLNFFSDPTFTDIDFHDVDHLSDHGATKFSSRLKPLLSPTQ